MGQIDKSGRVLDAHPDEDLRLVAEGDHFFQFEFVVHHEKVDAELQRITDVGLSLDGVRMEACSGLDAALLHDVDFPVGAHVKGSAFFGKQLDELRLGVRFDRVKMLDPGKRVFERTIAFFHPASRQEKGRRPVQGHQLLC